MNTILENKDKSLISEYKSKSYILIKINDVEELEINIKDIIKYSNVDNDLNFFDPLENYKSIVDKFEMNIIEYNNEYLDVQNISNYFVGLSENAISYLSDGINKSNSNNAKISMSHIELKHNNCFASLNDTLSLCKSYYVINIGRYIKNKIILKKENWYEELEYFLSNEPLNELDYRILYSEILFPDYFYKLFYKLLDEEITEKRIKELTKDIGYIENNLIEIHLLISKYTDIPKIEWLVRNN